MALNAVIGDATLTGVHHRRWNFPSPMPDLNRREKKIRYVLLYIYPSYGTRWLSTSAESTYPEFSGADNAYEVLGVPETSSFEDIKVSFRKLAKETHPDIVSSDTDSKRFVEILAAYEILSDSTKRAHYDQYLFTTRHIVQKQSREGSSYHVYANYGTTMKQMEVVEWLRWYRYAVKDILSDRRLPAGSSYFDVLQRELYSAIHSAYFGPETEFLDFLPDRFEAEERSVCETPDVLHLVSGRDLFGIVRIANGVPELSDVSYDKLTSFSANSYVCRPLDSFHDQKSFACKRSDKLPKIKAERVACDVSDAYENLELHVCGRLVAIGTRVPPNMFPGEGDGEHSEDHIHVFLSSNEQPMHASHQFINQSTFHESVSNILLGTINGLGTNPDESSCYVYNSSGAKTHVILKHRTPLVKHMHWFQLGDEVSICECRCTRARLPPSKFWLFEPRSSMHDIGGWYVETYGRDKKNHNIPSQRYWDGTNAYQQSEKRLHPAVYLLALAYRTLDIENARRTKRTIWEVAQGNLSKIFSWCKKLV